MTDHDDSLETAARTLREATDAPSPEAAATRARILAAHAAPAARAAPARTRLPVQWLAAAAVLVIFLGVPSAWALTTGRVSRWIEAIVGPAEVDAPTPDEAPITPPRRSGHPRTHGPSTPTAPEPTLEPTPIEPSPIEPSIDPTPIEPLPIDHDRAETLPSQARAIEHAPLHEDTSERDERLAYQSAREIELGAHDPAVAIAAYDAYLASHPSGRFATEARYHRAVSLANAGRDEEAIRALTPFTNGGYREAEARELIEALQASEQP